jgi:hypothetical protein
MEHPDTIKAAANLATTHTQQGRWEEGATLRASAVQLSLQVLGQQHPDTQNRLRDLVFVYGKLGKEKEAQETLAPDIHRMLSLEFTRWDNCRTIAHRATLTMVHYCHLMPLPPSGLLQLSLDFTPCR